MTKALPGSFPVRFEVSFCKMQKVRCADVIIAPLRRGDREGVIFQFFGEIFKSWNNRDSLFFDFLISQPYLTE